LFLILLETDNVEVQIYINIEWFINLRCIVPYLSQYLIFNYNREMAALEAFYLLSSSYVALLLR
jgi:hypothetical protein